MASPVPIEFAYDEDARALLVSWSDGARHRIPFSTLRRACPCAVCQGEMGSAGRFSVDPDLRPGEDELADVLLVGSYGVTPVWAGGHQTGIFTFAHLRQLGESTTSAGTPPPASRRTSE